MASPRGSGIAPTWRSYPLTGAAVRLPVLPAKGGKAASAVDSPPEAPMNLVFVAAEVAPWSKTGGLGDVMGGLPVELAARGAQRDDRGAPVRPVQGRVGHGRRRRRDGRARALLPFAEGRRGPRLRGPPLVPGQGLGQDGFQALREEGGL